VSRTTMRAIMSGEARGPQYALLRGVLWLLSLLYGVVARAKNFAFDVGIRKATRVTRPDGSPLPIICVGNLTAGGTGKTPMVELVVGELQSLGKTTGILSRGYRGSGASPTTEGNDEARVLAELLPGVPHVQNPDRIAGARELARLGVDVVVMDDGFSHRRLARDLDILLFDATCPFGFGHLLPRGLLREPVSAAKRAGFAVVTRADAVGDAELAAIKRQISDAGVPGERVVTASHRPRELISIDANSGSVSPESLRGQYVFDMCGLGNPAAFHTTLRTLGATVVGTHDLPDHFAYDEMWVKWEWPKVTQRARELGATKIIVTQKDAVKLRGRITGTEVPVYELRVQMDLGDGREALADAVKHVV